MLDAVAVLINLVIVAAIVGGLAWLTVKGMKALARSGDHKH